MTRPLVLEVQNALNYMRKLLEGNRKILSKIDKSYEETILTELKLVPPQYDEDILNIIRIVKIVLSNINYSRINEGFQALPVHIRQLLIPETVIDLFGIFKKCIGNIQMQPVDRARIVNIVSKFRPLFTCIDELLKDPINTVGKISSVMNPEVFEDFGI